MSIHSSLRSSGSTGRHRSVLKRYERLQVLKGKSVWSEEKSALGLPKVKQQKLKIKKEKAAGAEAKTAAGAAPAAAAPAAAKPAGKAEAKTDKK
jgi:small basic protein (TIGR04137 family)